MVTLLLAGLLALQVPAAPPRDAPARPAEAYTIRGRVTDVTSGLPLRGVEITIRSTGETGSDARGTLTDDDGRWEFGRLSTGDYVLNHHKAGYTRVSGVRIYSPVHVSAQFPLRHLDLVLARGGVVTGRVTDPMGEPAVAAQVQAHLVIDGRVATDQHQDMTDDRGEFRLFGLMPGEYLLSAEPTRRHDNVATADGMQAVRTYYPGTLDTSAAERLFVLEQGTLSDLTFQLARARLFSVTGRVVSAGRVPEMAHVHLRPAQPDTQWTPIGHGGAIDGQFLINNVPPGAYVAVANVRTEKGEEEFGEAPVVVGHEDASVTVVTRPPIRVRGRVVAAAGTLADIGRVHVGATPVAQSPAFHGSPGRVLEDGTFEFTMYAPRFRVRVWGQSGPAAWRQTEVRWRGAAVGPEGLDGTGGDIDGVEIVVVAATARVQGTVRELREGTVLLVPQEDDGEFGAGWHRAVLTDGRFVSPPLPPGRYIMAAVAALSPGEITPDLAQAVRAQGQALELGDREVRSVDVVAIVEAK
jgi:hypothetical protein